MRILIRLLSMLAAVALVAAACGDDDEPTADNDNGGDTGGDEVAMGPASIAADDQESDGSSVIVASVTLPSPGFIVIHGDGDGAPGAVIGHSDLLPAGESTGVVVALDEPLTESGVVFPMAHIDVDGDGVYEFAPPDETTDLPALTDGGDVAVVPATVTVAGSGDLQLGASDLGDILVDASGNVLYLFVPDAQGDSVCYDDCEAAWPIVSELGSVGAGLDSSLLGTTERTNGDIQATYNDWPLYYFVNDAAPGDTNGQTVGDVWYVMDAAGDAIGGPPELVLAPSDLGDILVDASGNVLYLFVPDAQGDSVCYDDCEVAWPVFGEVAIVGSGLDAGLLGATERTNGDIQATYNGWPLYYFVNDEAAGDTNGQGVGDVWYVMDAAGDAIGGPPGLVLAPSDLGDILTDPAGNVLYLFVPDAQGDSVCYDDCETAWPVFGEVAFVGTGLDAGLLGTTERTNGDIQATYNDWPLYYFVNDEAPGDTNGQGVGDVWYVLDAAGDGIGVG